ncbi:MAG: prepilin-type N-terminal cleavage/methylation domain-containing protein [Puniceicoccales bacterium]|jgi:prepilin-type N-terminal cleavage/methylation domain-containing protein|nr:prepilin-type N-terminal cleavage/methylation domain-containing protein [Puniceicoccales bacterium]
MKFKKSGFTLIEMLVGIIVAGVALAGMFVATMSYMKIWREVSGSGQNESFNRQTVTRRFLSNELSSLLMGLDKLEGNSSLTFRKLNGSQAIYGDNDVHLYWESSNPLPLIEQDNGGITQCWLVFEKGRGKAVGELRLYYRSLKSGEAPDFSGGKGNAGQYFTLLEDCEGVDLGYTSIGLPNVRFYSTPLFSNGKDPDLPEVIQISLRDAGANKPVI